MKTTIYDLLGMIKDGKAPKKIKYANEILEYDGYKIDYTDSDGDGLFNEYAWITELNEEVEILDEPKENKIIDGYVSTYVLCDSDFEKKGKYSLKATEIIDKAFEEYSYEINELIDEVNKLKEK